MSKQETSHLDAHQVKYINGWFDRLTLARDDPKTKYTGNVRYQNTCAKIESVEDELNFHEKSSFCDQNGDRGIFRKRTCSSCDRPREEENKMTLNDRNVLIADIVRILPDIRQRLL